MPAFTSLRLPLAALTLASAIVLLPAPAKAAPIATGELQIAGLDQVVVGQTFMNFLCSGLFGACPAEYGDFIRSAVTGDFAIAGTTSQAGFIHSLNTAVDPINAPFLLSNFITFNPAADAVLDLTFVYTGVNGQVSCFAAPAAGQACTPALPALVTAANPLGLSPFNLSNTQTGSVASISVAGVVRRLSTGEAAPFTGLFSAQFNVPYQVYLETVVTGGTVRNSYSATFEAHASPVVPEPASLTLLLTGVAAGGLRLRRRLRRSGR